MVTPEPRPSLDPSNDKTMDDGIQRIEQRFRWGDRQGGRLADVCRAAGGGETECELQ
jgi:hypothetical protein